MTDEEIDQLMELANEGRDSYDEVQREEFIETARITSPSSATHRGFYGDINVGETVETFDLIGEVKDVYVNDDNETVADVYVLAASDPDNEYLEGTLVTRRIENISVYGG